MAFVEEFYKVPWEAVQAFDLVINTSKISPDLATSYAVEAAKAFAIGPKNDQPTTDSIEVNPILAAAISEKLKCSIEHNHH